MSRIFLILLYIFIFNSCKKVSVKPTTQSYTYWFNKYNYEAAEGDIVVISSEKSVSASFTYTYDKNKRELSGSLFALFGLKVADFIITDNGIKVFNSKGDSISIQKIISQNIIPSEVFINFVTYHFPFISNKDVKSLVIPEGELLSYRYYNLLLHNEKKYPIKSVYVTNGQNIEAVFSNFKSINDNYNPHNVIITSGSYKLEVKFRKIQFE